jgi:hypothetical protein
VHFGSMCPKEASVGISLMGGTLRRVDHVFLVIFQELLQGEDERGGDGEKSNDIR